MKMSECITEQKYNINWRSDEIYKRVNQEIDSWPEWKKEAYNEMFAFSTHTKLVCAGKR